MKLFIRLPLLICLVLAAGLPSSFAQGPAVTEIEIRHVGPPAASDAFIRGNIRVKEGDLYRRTAVDDDVRNLFTTGRFHNIRVVEEREADGVKLIYVMQGKPVLTTIHFSGNERYNDRRLRKRITSAIGEPLDERKLFSDARAIREMYQKAGYHGTEVDPVISIDDESTGRGSVTFEINEAPRVRIQEIEFIGNQAFTDRRLRRVLKTKERWLFSWLTGSDILREERFQEDKDRLVEFYQNEGYIDFEILDVALDHLKPKRMAIRFHIREGQRYEVGGVTISGNKLFSDEEILGGIAVEGRQRRVELTPGSIFTPRGLTRDVEALRDFYGSKGYIDTEIYAIKQANVIDGTMDLIYEIVEHDQSFIERIDIRGNVKTKDKVIRRELAVSPGEVYDMVRVKLSQQRLDGLNYFEKVDIRPEETDIPNRRNLVVGVDEKSTGNLTLGAGLSSVDSVVGFVELSQGNFDLFKPPTFTGAGQKFRMRAQVGTRRQDYQISFVEPWFLDRKLALGVDLYHRDLNFLSLKDLYEERHTGGTVSLTRALWSDFLIGRVSYTLENIGINFRDADISERLRELAGDGRSRYVSKVGTSLAYDTRNNALLPSRGQRTELSGDLAGGPFGGDTDFWRAELRTAWYFPGFLEGHIVELVGRGGVVDNYGDSRHVFLPDRYFLGGLYSLRGFRYREVGPRDRRGEPIGGETYWFGSAEYSIPIIERLRFAVFYDIGNVYEDAFKFQTQSNQGIYSDNWGVGLRINLPIGPLRLDYGVPIKHDAGVSGSGRFQFGVGYTREF